MNLWRNITLSGIYTISPTHCGIGQACGAVDLPIARDASTQFPVLPATSIKGVVRDFLVTGNITNATNRIQWSGINDITVWSGKQSDLQDLPGSGGQIVHITSGEVGYVFRQNQIVRMDYAGGATVFRLSVISPNRGAVYGRTVDVSGFYSQGDCPKDRNLKEDYLQFLEKTLCPLKTMIHHQHQDTIFTHFWYGQKWVKIHRQYYPKVAVPEMGKAKG